MRRLLISTLSLLGLFACGDDGRPVYRSFDKTVLELAKEDPNLSTFVELVTAAGLDEALGGTQAVVTVFAPTNAAFSAIPAADVAALKADPIALAGVLQYHMAGGFLPANLVVLQKDLRTITSTTVHVLVNGSEVSLRDYLGTVAKVTKVDQGAKNGMLHQIDKVLTPPPAPLPDLATALTDGGYAALLGAVDAAGLTPVLTSGGPFTVFAPTDDAFGEVDTSSVGPDVLANILLHHVVAGAVASEDLVAGSPLTSAAKLPLVVTAGPPITVGGADLGENVDVAASDGVIHELASVIIPPTTVDVVVAGADFSTLEQAVTRANVAAALTPNTIEGEEPITVFAPTNAAFTASGINVGTVGTSTLTQVLTSHVVPGQLLSSELFDGQLFRAASGMVLEVDITGEDVFIVDEEGNRSQVVDTDIRTLSGVVHVVSGVIGR